MAGRGRFQRKSGEQPEGEIGVEPGDGGEKREEDAQDGESAEAMDGAGAAEMNPDGASDPEQQSEGWEPRSESGRKEEVGDAEGVQEMRGALGAVGGGEFGVVAERGAEKGVGVGDAKGQAEESDDGGAEKDWGAGAAEAQIFPPAEENRREEDDGGLAGGDGETEKKSGGQVLVAEIKKSKCAEPEGVGLGVSVDDEKRENGQEGEGGEGGQGAETAGPKQDRAEGGEKSRIPQIDAGGDGWKVGEPEPGEEGEGKRPGDVVVAVGVLAGEETFAGGLEEGKHVAQCGVDGVTLDPVETQEESGAQE
jgi:hypothetical protein